MRLLYTILYYLALPAILIRLLLKSRHDPAYRKNILQRFGFAPHIASPSVWIHAVSLGESIIANTLIERLLAVDPSLTIIVTTTTSTGAHAIQSRSPLKNVIHSYFPYDLPGAIHRFIQRTRPQQMILVETELWPNLLNTLKRHNIPLVIANGRLSKKTATYYQKISCLWRPLLSNTTICAISTENARRFAHIGANSDHLHVIGNIKFDRAVDISAIERGQAFKRQHKGRCIWIAASTHEGEESIVLQAHSMIRKKYNNALLILVPRHPERFDTVYRHCQAHHSTQRRSKNEAVNTNTSIYLGDTLGELPVLYASADIAFVGASLVPIGGHNLIEPAQLSLPIITGPYLDNCREIAAPLEAASALTITPDADTLAMTLLDFFQHPEKIAQQGAEALSISERDRGALDRLMTHIKTPNPHQ